MDVAYRPVCAAGQLAEFGPRTRHGDTHAGAHAGRPRRDGGGAEAVAQVVDKDLADAVAWAHLGDEQLRKGGGQVRDDGLREGLHGIPVVLAADGHDDMQPLAAAGLEKAGQAELTEEGMQQLGPLLHGFPIGAGAGVEVEGDAIGLHEGRSGGVPRMEFDDVHLGGREQAEGGGHFHVGLVIGIERLRQLADAGHLGVLEVFLKELLALDAAGCADERDGAALEVGHHQRADQPVMADELDLGDAGGCIDDAVGVADLELGGQGAAGFLGLEFLRVLRAFANDVLGGLVVAQGVKDGMPEMAVLCPVRKRDFGQQGGLDPVRLPIVFGGAGEGAGLLCQLVQLGVDVDQGLVVEAGADAAGIDQAALLVVDADQDGAQGLTGAFGVCPAADDELLPMAAFELDPIGGAGRGVGAGLAFADDAFEPHLAGGCDHVLRRGVEGVAESQCRGGIGEQRAQGGSAIDEGEAGEVDAVVEGQVEEEVDKILLAVEIEGVLQRLEIGRAVGIEDHDFAVEPSGGQVQIGDLPGDAFELGCPVVPVAGEQADLAPVVDAGEHAVAVELDLEQPVFGLGRRLVDQGGEHGAHLGRQGAARRCGGLASGRRGGACADLAGGLGRGLRWRRRALSRGRCCEGGQGGDAVGQFVDDAEFGCGSGEGVFFLDEQPGVLAGVLAFDADERPAPLQLVAVELEFEIALGITFVGIADGHPGALVPDDDFARAVLFGGDDAFEGVVADGVVFDVDGHAFVGRIEAGAFGHGPAFHGAVELEAQVVMQAAGPVFLDDELPRGFIAHPALGGLGGEGEVAFGFVFFERIGSHGMNPAREPEVWVSSPDCVPAGALGV